MTKVYSATESFLEIIGNQIYTQENAQAVMDELRDHVLTSTTDYLALGYSEEEAEAKALKQMGEPSELGIALNDPKEAARRAMWRRAYRVLALVLPLSFIVVLSWPFLMGGDIYRIGRPSLRGAVTDGVDFLNLYNVINLLVIGTVLNSRYIGKCSYLGFKLKPLLVVWPVRKRVRLDLVWLAVGITFGGPMLVAYYMPAFAEGFEPRWFFMESYLLLSVVGAWLAYRRSEVHRIPKVIVSSEGMVIREKFISWTAIDSFSWMRIKVGDNHYYKLKLKNAQGRRIADEIEVSQNQKSIMDSLLAVHMSKGGAFFENLQSA